jgi:hypothetical protein
VVDFTTYREVSFKEMLKTGGAAAGGLTVRDYFAAEAMGAALHADVIEYLDGKPEEYALAHATFAYKMADAMMKERNKKPDEPAPTVEEAFGL